MANSGRINITVSTASGQSCKLTALASGHVDQLHGPIERTLKIPQVLQRLVMTLSSGDGEISSEERLGDLGIKDGSQVMVISSWPSQPAAIIEKLKLAAFQPSQPTAAAISLLLTHEEKSVKIAALQALAWMGRHGSAYAAQVAELLREDAEVVLAASGRYTFNDPSSRGAGIRNAAASALSWLEEAGAAFAADVLTFCWQGPRFAARTTIEAMCQSESAKTRTAAFVSMVRMLENDCEPCVVGMHKVLCRRIILRYVCQGLFDECDEVQKTCAAYLMNCVPPFADNFDFDTATRQLSEELLTWFIRFGQDGAIPTGKHEQISLLCADICKKLDGYWPKWQGWQEIF